MEIIIILIAILTAAAVCLLVKHRGIIEFVSSASAAVVFIIASGIALKVAATGTYAPNQFFAVDALGAIVMLVIAVVGLAATVYSVVYLRQETTKQVVGFRRVKQYFILLNFFLAAMFLAIASSSPVVTWIAIEATTLSTAFLISFYNKPSSMEAAWKYLIINSVGLLCAFFGTLLYFTLLPAGEAGFTTWHNLFANATRLDPLITKIAFIFILIGYGTKVGLAPMHTWLPDAHSKAPAPISALLSGVLLNVALIAVLRFKVITDASIGPDFSQKLLIAFGIFSIFVAALIIFTQKNYKRLLAYSSIENMGIMALGFGLGGLGVMAATLHMIYHALVKSALFFSAGNIFLKYSSTKIAKVTGLLTTLPVTSVVFMICFFAIIGLPPFGIFLTKIFILSAGINLYPIITVVAVLLIALVFVGFFKQVAAMVFGAKPAELKAGEESVWLIIPPLALIAIVLYLSFHTPLFLSSLLTAVAGSY